ncbi:MAG TPA: 16S rRNA (cytidine(1402)-2'-O)-methyltransferase [Acidimicrobiales bacterium]|nr:16S rRNA (cytidine(1402)-2'-O)-methyltransferase [Acidimicrobiales bacterium]
MTGEGPGALVLVATPIGNLGDLSPRAVEALAGADVIACEDTRHSRKLLHHAGITTRRLVSVHAHNEREQAGRLVAEMAAGRRVAYVSDAGTPGISDPGERLVQAALAAGVAVEVVPGPSALLAALVLSGLPAHRFCFEGFLPRRGGDRARRLHALAAEARTTVLYEAPHRIEATMADLAEACGGERRVAVARELTKRFEEVWRGRLAEAVEHVKATPPRGEYVVVVEGAPVAAEATEAEIEVALQAHLEAGMSTRDAVAAVSEELSTPKRRVYAAALRLRR